MRVRWGLACGVAIVLAAGIARAADKPVIGPPEAWVKPSAVPANDGKSNGQAVRLLLQDQQVHFGPDGTTTYFELAMKVQTPQGLAAGNISLPWNPDTDTLTIHKLRILRGGKSIDVLASQRFTVLRRETNLENAVLDGMLTANIQPEGLQVGDVIDFAASVKRNDPALKGHAEALILSGGGAPVDHAQLRAEWPNGMPIRWRETEGLPPLKQSRSGGETQVSFAVDDMKPAVLPKGAPMRFAIVHQAEFTDFRSWADLAALLAPLYVKAAAIPPGGALAGEVARIAALSPDPRTRAEAALALVQNQVRYVFLGMNDGGLVPADAETTWSRRFGDCKGKTALLLGLLHALGIAADPVVVSSSAGDGLDQRLPMIGLFDHVLVRAVIGGKTYWLDGTRLGDRKLDDIQAPAFHWGLPLVARGAALTPIMPGPLDKPEVITNVRIDASAGINAPAPAHVEILFRGDGATALHMQLDNLTADARDRGLRDYWRGKYSFITPAKVSASYDAAANEERLTLDGAAKMDWSGAGYETDGMGIGYTADFTRDPGPHADAPFAVSYPAYSLEKETILLPDRGKGFTLDDATFDKTIAGVAYHRSGSLKDGVVTLECSERAIEPEFPANEAAADQAELRRLGKLAIYVRQPANYVPTSQDVAAAMADTPTTADGFVSRGNMLMHKQRYDEAIADFNSALKLDPKDAYALADRGIAHIWKQEKEDARKDFDAAAAIDPKNAVVFRGRGLLAEQAGDNKAEVAALTTSLELEPGNDWALAHRAMAYQALDEEDRALADAAAALRISPTWYELYMLRARIFAGQGKPEQAVAEARAVIAAGPENAYAHAIAGGIYEILQQPAQAMRAYDKAVALQPDAANYLNRYFARPRSDLAGRKADIEAALRVDPEYESAIIAAAELKEEQGDYSGALATLNPALHEHPSDANLLVRRGIVYAHLGKTKLADQDYAAARKQVSTGVELNDLCWVKATAGVSLESALADCREAVAKTPDAPILDSLGFVLLRLGRYDESIAAYDRALAIQPKLSPSLYGRAVAESRKGDAAKAAADRAAAVKLAPKIADTFQGYGVAMDGPAPAAPAANPTKGSASAAQH